MSLNYTPLRHKMLAAIANGQVSIGDRNEWKFTCWPSAAVQQARACNWAWDFQLIGVYREPGEIQLSDDGERTLNRWNARHGEPT